MMIYSSEANLDNVNDQTLLDLRDRGVEIGAIAAYFKHSLPEHPRRTRTAWSKQLQHVTRYIYRYIVTLGIVK